MAKASSQKESGPKTILVVEDERDLSSLLQYVLGQEGFRVFTAHNGSEALDQLRKEPPALVVLDLMLPDMNGLDILRSIKSNGTARTRVVILSARKDEADRIRGFELGADDYLVKPFSPRELILRINTILERGGESASSGPEVMSAGPIEIDLDHHEVRVSGEQVHLTLTEFRLLADMVRNQGRVRTRDVLMSEVWGYDAEAMSRTVDTHVRRLRNKLGDAASWLTTVRGVGYRVRKPE